MVNKLIGIKVKDAISIDNQDFIVDQVQKLGTGNTHNLNIRLRDGSVVKWLCVRLQGDQLAVLCTEIVLEEYPLGKTISWQGNDYHLTNSGSTRGIGTSPQGFNRFVTIEYKDFSGGDRWLFVNKEEQNILAFEGETVSLSALTIYMSAN